MMGVILKSLDFSLLQIQKTAVFKQAFSKALPKGFLVSVEMLLRKPRQQHGDHN